MSEEVATGLLLGKGSVGRERHYLLCPWWAECREAATSGAPFLVPGHCLAIQPPPHRSPSVHTFSSFLPQLLVQRAGLNPTDQWTLPCPWGLPQPLAVPWPPAPSRRRKEEPLPLCAVGPWSCAPVDCFSKGGAPQAQGPGLCSQPVLESRGRGAWEAACGTECPPYTCRGYQHQDEAKPRPASMPQPSKELLPKPARLNTAEGGPARHRSSPGHIRAESLGCQPPVPPELAKSHPHTMWAPSPVQALAAVSFRRPWAPAPARVCGTH